MNDFGGPGAEMADMPDHVSALRHVAVFARVEQAILAEIASTAKLREVPSGAVLIRQGDRAEALYLVVSGRFRVSNAGVAIAMIGPGAPIGELAFFAGGTRTADVTAMRDSLVMELDRAGYDSVVRAHPELASEILSAVSARLAAVTARAAPLPPQAGRVVMLVGIADGTLPAPLVEGVRAAAERRGDVTVVEAGDAPVSRGRAGLAEWLREHEARMGRVILVVRDPAAEPDWATFVAGACDSQFMVGPLSEARPPLPGSFEARVLAVEHGPGRQLVLWRERATAEISGTPAWLAGRNIALHHHLALDSAEDFQRLLRFMCDDARGLVLSGGGAFGTAHLGAFKALREAGVAIDFIGGTSVGAAMAAALASGLDPDEIMRRCDEIFVTSKAMGRYTAPLYSVLNHRVFDEQLAKHYGSAPVEDLPVNLFAVASSLSDNDIRVIRTGPVWKAVRASGSIPALLPPVIGEGGEVLIDGGLFDNLPLGVMRRLKAGPNIAMDFGLGRGWRVEADYDALPGPFAAALGLVLGRRGRPARLGRFPRIAPVLSRAMTMNSRRRIAETDFGADILLDLPVDPKANFLDWRRGGAHYATAHRELAAALARARATEAPDEGPDGAVEMVRRAAGLLRAREEA